jgi:hypothetical protein
MAKFWTTKEHSYLCENWGVLSHERLAYELNRSPEAVRQYASRNKLKSALVSKPKDYDKIKQMLSIGHHPSVIAEVVGTSTQALRRRVKNGKHYTKEDYEQLKRNCRRVKRIAQKFN